MKKRGLIEVLLLSLLTVGIYQLYWLISTKKEINRFAHKKIPTIWMLIGPVLLVTFSYIGIFTILFGNTSGTFNSGMIGALLIFIALISIGYVLALLMSVFWIFRYSKETYYYTKGRLDTPLTFLLFIVLQGIGIALIQDVFNDLIDEGVIQGEGSMMPPNMNTMPAQPMQNIEQRSNIHPPIAPPTPQV